MSEQTVQLNSTQRAALIARVVELNELFLTASQCELLVPRDQALQAATWHINHTSNSTFFYDSTARQLSVLVAFAFAATGDPEDSGALAGREFVRANCTFSLVYSLSSEPPEDQREALFQAFADINAVFNAWPYFREFVQDSTARFGLPPLVLRVLRIPPQPPRKKNITATESAPAALPEKKAR